MFILREIMNKASQLSIWLLLPVYRLLGRLLSLIMPRHGKRIMFNASLYFELCKEHYPNQRTLERLNKSLKLAKDYNALMLPAKLHHLFWNKRLNELLHDINIPQMIYEQDPEQVDLFCSILLNTTPNWMRYGRRMDMVNDIVDILNRAREENLSRGLFGEM